MEATFRSLRVRNYRLFFVGQLVSVSGTWMQVVALGWFVYNDLSDESALAVGVMTALQQVPMLLFGAWGGVLADRFDRRRTLVLTQAVAAASSFGLAGVVLTGTAEYWNVGALVLLAGLTTVVDLPSRQVFVGELVGRDNLINAVGLNSAVFNGARIFGPGLGAILIGTVGIGWSFFANGISFLATIASLLAMRPAELHSTPVVARAKGQIREGLRYIVGTPVLRANLVLMTIVGTLSINFPVVLPPFAKESFGGGAGLYGLFTAAMGLGAIVGALITAGRHSVDERMLARSAIAFGAMGIVVALAPNLAVALPLMVVMGVVNITLFATSNTLLQLQAAPEMRGRVLAVRGMTVLGTTPIGAPVVGWVTNELGPRAGLTLGGLAGLVAAAYLFVALRGIVDVPVEADEPPPDDLVSDPVVA